MEDKVGSTRAGRKVSDLSTAGPLPRVSTETDWVDPSQTTAPIGNQLVASSKDGDECGTALVVA